MVPVGDNRISMLYRIGKRWNPQKFRWERPHLWPRRKHYPGPHSDEHRQSLAKSWATTHKLTEPAWSALSETTLLTLRAEGLSYRQIARALNKTKAAVQARARYLSLGRRIFPIDSAAGQGPPDRAAVHPIPRSDRVTP